MKSFLYVGFLCIIICGFTIDVHASDNEELFLNENCSEYQEIVALKDEIYTSIISYHGNNLMRVISKDEIDFSQAFKVYVNTDLFAFPNINDLQLSELTTSADYVWILPIHVESATIEVTISLGQPLRDGIEESLTADEIEDIKNMAGHWGVPLTSTYAERIDYVQTVKEGIAKKGLPETGYTLQFFGGTYGMLSVFGLVSYPNGNRLMIPVMEPRDVMIDIRTDKLSFGKDAESSIQKGEVYNFSAVTKRIPVKIKVLFTLLSLGGVSGAVYFIHVQWRK